MRRSQSRLDVGQVGVLRESVHNAGLTMYQVWCDIHHDSDMIR